MAFDSFECFVSVKPLTEALQMDSSHGAWATTWRDHRIEFIVSVIQDAIIVVEADSANHCWLVSALWNLIIVNFTNFSFLNWISESLLRFSRFNRISPTVYVYIFCAVYFKALQRIRRVSQLDSTINTDSPFNLINPLTQINIIDINYRLRLPPIRAYICFIAPRSVWPRALALLGLVCVNLLLRLRIINISDS